jgi:ribA/ribD-fused uncharacterized protein
MTTKYKKYTFFYKTRNPFSNWHPAKFLGEDGLEYNCSEQYMMAEKARIFNDETVREMILAAKDPRDQKALGRKVSGFDTVEWGKHAKEVVYRACYHKFTQNPKLMANLMETTGTLLVEASPYDKIWGIGIGEDDPARLDPKKWKGTNWLGEILTKLREDLEVKRV